MTERGEHKAVMCMPVSYKGYVVPGSIQVKCQRCSQLVWLAPSSQQIVAGDSNTKIWCPACALTQIEKEGGGIAELTPKQMEEIAEYRKN